MFSQVGRKKSITQQVEEQLVGAIRNGTYLPRQKIPTENELCEMFDVSRTTIREAISKLSARGIVEVKRGSGVYVSEMSIQNASELLNIFFQLSSDEDIILQTINTRLLIEPMIASQAALLRTEVHLDMLRTNMVAMEKCGLGDMERETELDNNFHRTLLSITNNKILELLLSPIFNLMPRYREVVFAKHVGSDFQADKEILLRHHQNVLNAIEAQNEKAAAECMTDHIQETLRNYNKSLIS